MAQAQRETPTESQGLYSADQLVGFLDIIAGRTDRPTHPSRAPTARAAVNNSLRIWQIHQVVMGERPAEGDPMRRVYDQAIARLGEGEGRNAAIGYLQRALVASLQRLQELQPQDTAALGDNAAACRTMLQRLNRGAAADETGYDEFVPHLSMLTSLLGVTEGVAADAQVGPREVDQAARATALPIIEMPMHDLGNITLLSRGSSESVVAINATPGPTTTALFGDAATAQAGVNAIANGYAVLANHPNDAAAQRAAATALFNALSAIPSGREIWERPGFQDAMRKLQSGDLSGGLQSLAGESSLNSVFQSLNNLYVISVNQRAVAIMRAGVTVRYEFDENMQAFQEYMRGTRHGGFEPRFIWTALGMYYEYLAMSGQLQQLQVDPATSELRTVGRQRLTGSGHSVGLRPEIAIGTGVGGENWSTPMEIVIGATVIPYQQWSMSGNVAMTDGSTETLEVGDEGAMLGLTSVEVRFPGQEGNRGTVRLSRVGVGVVPTLEQDAAGETSGVLMNPLAYITMEGNWMEGNRVRLQSTITPQYSYFLRQHRVGADIRPLNLSVYSGEEGQHRFFVGPGLRYDYNFGNQVHTFEGYLGAGYSYRRQFQIDLRGGYLGEAGGNEVDRLPGTPFGGLNMQFNIGEFFRPSSTTGSVRSATPRRTEDE
jgi:hypothetical protein